MNQSIAVDVADVMVEAIASGLYVSLLTFQSMDGGQGPTGNPPGTYSDVAGLVNIPCMDAPLSPGTISALEAKALADIEAKGIRHVSLNGYYPAAVTGWMAGWRAMVDGFTYEVFGVEADSQTTQTRVKLQLVTI